MRDKGAAQRMRAAGDRARAARDREPAADREHLLAELEHAHLDDLTGAYRRGMGEKATSTRLSAPGARGGPSYDPVVRWGGDEFVCTISEADLERARNRFEEIRLILTETEGVPGSIGLAVLAEGDTLETLVERADADLLEARRRR